ncbi:hypothetical protein HYY70_01280 [Candidatus Woesearchaeota archaeon]|nr:hypothetical protein [Candidatus Woesearchaeota archaeon]
MKKRMILFLTLFLIGILAITVTSQIQGGTVSLEERQDCSVSYYNVTESVYGNVTRTRNTNTTCIDPVNLTPYICINGTESYQSYEITGNQIMLRNKTDCISRNSFSIRAQRDSVPKNYEIDFSNWGPCIHSEENGCVIVTCVSKYDGAHQGKFTDCKGGKSCQRFEICNYRIKVYYKNSRAEFAEDDPSFYLSQLAIREVEE